MLKQEIGCKLKRILRQVPAVAFVSCLLCLSPRLGLTQSNISVPAEPTAPINETDADLQEFEALIQETAEERVQLKQKLQRMSEGRSTVGKRAGGIRSITRRLAHQIDSDQEGFERRSEAIRRKLARLKKQVGNIQDCDDNSASHQRPANRRTPSNNGDFVTRSGVPQPAQRDQRIIPNVISDIVQQDTPMNDVPQDQIDASMLDQIKIMNGPIDRLSLANNLFASGSIDLALEVYKHIDPRTLSALDKNWLAYQIASCHRLLGSRDKAERGYRVVTRESGNNVLGRQSKWWLDHLDRESKLQTRKDRIQKSLIALREQFDEQTKSTRP